MTEAAAEANRQNLAGLDAPPAETRSREEIDRLLPPAPSTRASPS